MAAVVRSIDESRLDLYARRIQEAHDRIIRGGSEWVDGSLDLAKALSAGRDAMPANIAFSEWLKDRKLDFYKKDERTALINLAADLDLARQILSGSKSRSYQVIWRDYQKQNAMADNDISRVRKITKTKHKRNYGRGMLHRRTKLGDELVDRIKDTSLDNAKEMDELVMLNRGAPAGEHTEIVKQLVTDAIAGKPVSAIAYSANSASTRHKEPDLLVIWKKRMVTAWQMASHQQQQKLIEFLITQMKG